MPDIQFEEEKATVGMSKIFNQNRLPAMARALINMGIVKDIRQANILLVVTTIFIFALSIFIVIRTTSSNTVKVPPAPFGAVLNMKTASQR